MTALDLFKDLQTLGVVLTPAPDGTIRYKAPHGVMTDELCEAIRTHKEALRALIEGCEEVTPEPHAPAIATSLPPCALCGGAERWDDHGILRCVTCYPPGSMTLQRTMETLLACRRCGSMAAPVGSAPYPDGSVLMRCPDCRLPRMAIPPEHERDDL
jgi:hypothetical protein